MDTELAWAAGFFDGEGSTSQAKSTNGRFYSKAKLTVPQKHRECLDRFRKAVGTGIIYGPLKDYNIYHFSIQNAKGVDTVLTKLWPYLSEVKRQQAIRCGFQLGVIRTPKVGRPKKEHACA